MEDSMKFNYITVGEISLAVLEEGAIMSVADALDVIATASYNGAAGMVVPMELLTQNFSTSNRGWQETFYRSALIIVCALQSSEIFLGLPARRLPILFANQTAADTFCSSLRPKRQRLLWRRYANHNN